MLYFVKSPWWLQKLYKNCVWKVKTNEKAVFLTFDDGPHPVITPFVLEILAQYKASATFFCIGDNVKRFPEIYERILAAGHAVGNHTFNHLNGWKTSDNKYIDNIEKTQELIDSKLFRPPYGRIRFSQLKKISTQPFKFKTIMWTVLSGDFDKNKTGEQCYKNVINNLQNGSIIVFHDSDKAQDRLRIALPKILETLSTEGYIFKSLY